MKTEQGTVVDVIGNVAKVKVGRHSDCSNCGACPGDNSIIIDANNKIGAKVGQRVAFEVKDTNVLIGAFAVFVLPLIVAFFGVLLGRFIANHTGSNINVFQITGGIIAFLLSMVFVKLFDISATGSEKSQPTIINIL